MTRCARVLYHNRQPNGHHSQSRLSHHTTQLCFRSLVRQSRKRNKAAALRLRCGCAGSSLLPRPPTPTHMFTPSCRTDQSARVISSTSTVLCKAVLYLTLFTYTVGRPRDNINALLFIAYGYARARVPASTYSRPATTYGFSYLLK